MPELNAGVDLRVMEDRSIVALRIARGQARKARLAFQLAEPLNCLDGPIASLWLGPDQWLLVSDDVPAESILQRCNESLSRITCITANQSAAYTVLQLTGPGACTLLGAGCGIDLRIPAFGAGEVRRTRLAAITAVLAARGDAAVDVYIDRSHADYLQKWLAENARTLSVARNIS